MKRRFVLALGSLLLGAAIASIMLLALALQRHALAGARHLQAAEAVLTRSSASGQALQISMDDLNTADADLSAAQVELNAAQHDLTLFRPAFALGSRLPVVGPSVAAIPHAVTFASVASTGARALIAGLRPVAAERDHPSTAEPAMARLVSALAAGAPSFAEAQREFDRAEADRGQIDDAALLGPARRALAPLQRWDAYWPVLQADLALLNRLPPVARAVLGYDAPQSFALLGQNSAELRPTGGFLGSMGILQISRGQVTGQSYGSLYAYDPDNRGQSRSMSPAPSPIAEHLGIAGWHIQDANWSPDFPTAANDFRAFLRYDAGLAVDGVITFDSYAVQELLRALGPVEITVDGQTQRFTADNWLPITTQLVFLDPFHPNAAEGKNRVLAPLLQAVIGRVNTASGDQITHLFDALRAAVAGRHILFQFDNPIAQHFIYDYGADGRLPRDSDAMVIYPVEANLSYTKIGPFIQAASTLEVWCGEPAGCRRARLVLSWTNTITPAQIADPANRVAGAEWDAQAAQLVATPGWYGFYERVYAPPGTALLAAEGDQVEPIGQASEEGYTVFGTYLNVRPGETRRLALDLSLPGTSHTEKASKLLLPKQPGTQDRQIEVILHGAQATHASIAMIADDSAGTYRYRGPFNQNISIDFRLRN